MTLKNEKKIKEIYILKLNKREKLTKNGKIVSHSSSGWRTRHNFI